MSLKFKLLATLIAVGVLNAAGVFLLRQSSTTAGANSLMVNLAGAQRMLSQRMAKEALLLARKEGDAAALREASARFQRVLSGLRNGDAELGLPPSPTKEITEQLRRVEEIWTPFRDAVGALAEGKGGEAEVKRIVEGNAALLAESHRAVGMIEQWAASRSRLMQLLQAGASLLLFALLAGVWLRVIGPLVTNLTDTIRTVSAGSDQLAAAAAQISSSSQSLAELSSRQAGAIEDTSSSAEEVRSMAKANGENSRTAAELMSSSRRRFETANAALGESEQAMEEINEQSSRIARIIKVIDEIAFQTNILALNAAVEAARAGEAGMGFAVVADEVRNLAQRSAQAARDTTALIEESIEKSHRGKEKVDIVASTIRQISQEVVRMESLVTDVSSGSQQQTTGIDHVSRAVSQLQQTTQTTAADAEETASAASEISAQAGSMREVVHRLSQLVEG